MATNQIVSPAEQIAIWLISEWLQEFFINRTIDEYKAIARRIPKLEACCEYVNNRLAQMAEDPVKDEICHFRAGDRHIRYVRFPTSMSKETIRTALVKSGFSALKKLSRGQ